MNFRFGRAVQKIKSFFKKLPKNRNLRAYWKSISRRTKVEFFLLGLAVLTLIIGFATLFTSYTDTQITTSSSIPLALGSSEFKTALRSITHSEPIPLSNGIQILNNGDEFMPDILDEIGKAEHSIVIANYIWDKGQLTDSLLDALRERAQAGVKVKIILDGKGGFFAPQDKLDALKSAGGEVAVFRPIGFRALTRINKRMHVRAIAIDGKVAYTGGAAFDDGWLGDGKGENEWRDMMFKLTGPDAIVVEDTFNDLWRQTQGEILSGPDFYPLAAAEAASSTSYIAPLFHSPAPDLDENLSNLLWTSVRAGRDHIYIETPYLMPDDNVLRALKDKAEAGVDVEIVVPGGYIESHIIQAATRSFYSTLLDSGVHIYEYQPGRFHSKMLSVDGEWSVIGSANMDNRSSNLNVEDVFGIEDKAFAATLDSGFLDDRANSTEIKPGSFQTNIFTRSFGFVSRLFAKQY